MSSTDFQKQEEVSVNLKTVKKKLPSPKYRDKEILNKNEHSDRDVWDNIKYTNLCVIKYQ